MAHDECAATTTSTPALSCLVLFFFLGKFYVATTSNETMRCQNGTRQAKRTPIVMGSDKSILMLGEPGRERRPNCSRSDTQTDRAAHCDMFSNNKHKSSEPTYSLHSTCSFCSSPLPPNFSVSWFWSTRLTTTVLRAQTQFRPKLSTPRGNTKRIRALIPRRDASWHATHRPTATPCARSTPSEKIPTRQPLRVA